MKVDHKSSLTNLSEFSINKESPEALFGLPKNVKFCQKCVISNQRPSSTIEYKKTTEDRQETIGFDNCYVVS
jgi:hypothetical protein